MMSERLSLSLFRRVGLPAPRLAHARLYVNENYVGLYTMVEPVDKAFLRRVFSEDKGDLYDYGWVSEHPIPSGPRAEDEYFQRWTAPPHLVPPPRLPAIAKFIDAKAFVKYVAAETFTADIDGFLGDWGINNLYLYRNPGATRFTFIAWDKDVTFRDSDRDIWMGVKENVLARRILAIPEFRETYLAALEGMINAAEGPGGWLEKELDRAFEQVRVAALEDTQSPYAFSEYNDAVTLVRNFLTARPASLLRQIREARTTGALL